QQMPLPETGPKAESRKRLQEREEELLRQIGLREIIRFDNLEDTSHLSSCLATFSENFEKGPICVASSQLLDPDDERLLEDRFKNSLKLEMKNLKDYDIKFKNLKVFVQSVLESSLINTIFSQSNPEIGQFLHLPEIDPRLVRNYDKEIVGRCIKEYIRSILSTLNISFIDTVLKEVEGKVSKKTVAMLKKKVNRLRDYVLGLLGSFPEDQKKAKERWIILQEGYQSAKDSVLEKFKLPPWATVLLCIPSGIPYGIYALIRWNELKKEEQKKIEETIDHCSDDLDRIYNALVKLKDLEKIIEKQEIIDEVFYSGESFFESKDAFIASIQNKIQKIRANYGIRDWDERIEIMKKKLGPFGNHLLSDHFDIMDFLSWVFFDKDISSSVQEIRLSPIPINYTSGWVKIIKQYGMFSFAGISMQELLYRVSTDLDIDLKNPYSEQC
ncbi:hypothetical protein, partial [Candidatus Protochlamydia amoebophila]